MKTTYKFVSSSIHLPGSQKPTLLSLVEKPRTYSGYIHGYRQPVGVAKLQVNFFHPSQMTCLQEALDYYFNAYSKKFNPIQSSNELVAVLGEGVCAIQKSAGLPVFEPVRIEVISEEDHLFSLWVPILHEECFHWTMAFMLQFITHHLSNPPFLPQSALLNEINTLINNLKNDAPKGPNSLRLLEAAHHEGIPWCHLAQSTFQYGYGRNSRWFYSTFTDETSHLAAGIVKDKKSTLSLLRHAGYPVPEQKIVCSEADAVEKANKMGYPVVIKPYNQDSGRGVTSRILSEDQVKKAFINASHYSEIVLMEKYIAGKDYRLLVLNGELIWAIERIPAGVTGDGISSIHELIDKMNQQPDRSNGMHFILKKVEITESMTDFLSDQGLTLNSVPESGQFIPINRIANISTGGTPVAVFDKVHPDNKRLVETAASLLRLNLAGVDLITSNIEQSYLETGGALIEINAQPDLGIITTRHIYKQILSTLLPCQGRIPIIVIFSHTPADVLVQSLMTFLSGSYQNIGVVKESNAYLNNTLMSQAHSSFNAANALLLNKDLDVFIYCIHSLEDIHHQGLPFDQYDFLFFLDPPLFKNNTPAQYEIGLMNTLFRACEGYRLINENMLEALPGEDLHTHDAGILSQEDMFMTFCDWFCIRKNSYISITNRHN